MKNREQSLRLLRGLDIPFSLYEHQPLFSMRQCLEIDIDWTRTEIPKNVFLCNRQQTRFYLLLLRHDVPFRTAAVSNALGVSRLSFAPEDRLAELLGLTAGAVSPLGLAYDTRGQVTLVADEGLRGFEQLAFHPCDNTATVVLRADDFWGRLLPAMRRAPVWVTPPAADEPDKE